MSLVARENYSSRRRQVQTTDRAVPRLPVARHAYRVGFVVATASVVVCVVLLPFAIASVLSAYRHPLGGRGYDLVRPVDLSGEWTKLNIAATSIDEANETMTLRVSGFHNCPSGCNGVERVQLYSLHSDPSGALGAPPSVTVNLPADSSEIDQQIALPISGDLINYPFDNYTLLLGVAFSKIMPSGAPMAIHPLLASHGLAYSVDDEIPRLSVGAPTMLSPARYDTTGVVFETVTSLTFFRPAYLRILTVLLTLLIILAAAYGVLIRPFTQIIPTVGALVLGVWGVRSLLVGNYPPDSTGVDLVLETAILLLLFAVAIRAVLFMWPKTHFGHHGKGDGGIEEQEQAEDREGLESTEFAFEDDFADT